MSDSAFSCFHSSGPTPTPGDCSKKKAFRQCYQIPQAHPLSVTMHQTQAGAKTLASSISPWLGHYYNPYTQCPLKYLSSNLSPPVDDFDLDLVVLICKGLYILKMQRILLKTVIPRHFFQTHRLMVTKPLWLLTSLFSKEWCSHSNHTPDKQPISLLLSFKDWRPLRRCRGGKWDGGNIYFATECKALCHLLFLPHSLHPLLKCKFYFYFIKDRTKVQCTVVTGTKSISKLMIRLGVVSF